ncbi:hypothetical protein Q7C36_003750 [Tachysurus vachellii]|uniref:Uncharacterized protein n=1 Tax=Tachysurus vachellii TaxID=175792 RepID=A0AA88NU08_TACVA|nr:hypothetical protein Q7C36_003750 [Tachysurus vachellii]
MEIIHDTEENIITELQKLLEKLEFSHPLHKPGNTYEQFYSLKSTVICVCYSDSDPKKYYGASLSCRTGNSKRILIDTSCLKTWHELESHAVMSFYPEDKGDHPYGNCAERECLSKLLLKNPGIHTSGNTNLRRLTTARLTEQLQKADIQMNDENILFYSPMQ